ncbi:MAG: hypothetical protein EAZ55_00465 [Cytophagales bacterium]|nr:MAG: hypothetical protein EAZ55_00465 [Cytophagales bacterium]
MELEEEPKEENKANEEKPMPINTTVATPKSPIRVEMIVASLSLLISLSTFVITAIQTQIMQNQQKAAVWAYLEAEISISAEGFYCQVQNKGVGAAIVKEAYYYVDGKQYKDFAQLAKDCIKDPQFSYDFYTTNPIEKKVFAANEKIKVFGVKEMKFASQLIKRNIVVHIKYENIYGELSVYKSDD